MMKISEMPKYDDYVDSGVEWLGRVPSHWQIIRLKNTINGCVNGLWGADPNGKDELVVVRVSDFDEQKLNVSDEKLTYRSIPENERKSRLLKFGDLLIEKSGGGDKTLVGRVVLFDKSYTAVTSNFVAKMTPKNWVNHSFLKYVFFSLYSRGVNYVSIKQTTGIQNLDANSYLNEVFCFPDEFVQAEVANFLDKKTALIDEAISIKEQQISLLKERKQIIIQQAVTQGLDPNVPMKDSGMDWIGKIPQHWKLKPNKCLFKLKKSLVGKRSGDYELLSLTLKGIIKRDMDNPEGKFPAEFNTYQEVSVGDFVFCLFDVEETPRTVGLSKFNGMITGAYTVFELDESVSKEFLYYFYLNLDSRKMMRPLYKGLRNTISKETFLSFKSFIPPLKEQEEIVDFIEYEVNKIDLTIDGISEQIDKIKEYKSCLINGSVTGKIKVTSEMAER
ncbi:restriction endonuclease subunit S [Escherichia coli]|uniref:restriction endonuclease subunit S n=1 Tax=Escherichia coli TaxID=562 RepID=UPI000B071227|nr:restriction endonuclease subunit S [Escherichia coli]